MRGKASPRAILAIALALLGIALTLYLTWVHYDTSALVCAVGNCHAVQESEFAVIGPVPVSLLGLGMFAVILSCELVRLVRPEFDFAAALVAFAVALSGTLYSAYLTWLEVSVIRAICQWCVASALLTALLMVVAGVAVWQLMTASAPKYETALTAGTSKQAESSPSGTGGHRREPVSKRKIVT